MTVPLTKKSRTLNCYSFFRFYKSSYQKQKLTNSLLVIVVAQFTAKTTNSEKDIYSLPLTSCSRNKLSHKVAHLIHI